MNSEIEVLPLREVYEYDIKTRKGGVIKVKSIKVLKVPRVLRVRRSYNFSRVL